MLPALCGLARPIAPAVPLPRPSLSARSQALELYRRVRLQTLAATKASLLASLPCTAATLEEHAFEVEQYQEVGGQELALGWCVVCGFWRAGPGFKEVKSEGSGWLLCFLTKPRTCLPAPRYRW